MPFLKLPIIHAQEPPSDLFKALSVHSLAIIGYRYDRGPAGSVREYRYGSRQPASVEAMDDATIEKYTSMFDSILETVD